MRFVVFFFCFIFFLDVQANTKTPPLEKITLQLQWHHQFEFAGFYAAKEKGFYQDVGLDVSFKEFTNSLDIVDEVLGHRAQYGLSYSSLIVDYMQGKPIVLVANFFKQSPLILITQPFIRTPADLHGKKVMGLLDSVHRQTLILMLEKFGLTKDAIKNIPRSFTLDDFIKKKIDAISVFTTNEVYELNKKGIAYNVFDPAAYGIKFYDLNLFTTYEEATHHPERVKNFKNASILGWEYALKHKEELVDIIYNKYNPQHKSKDALLFEAHQIEYLMLANVYPIGSIDRMKVEMIRDGFVQSGDIDPNYQKSMESFFMPDTLNLPRFTTEQKNYLQKKKEIKMCVDPNWMPLERIEEGVYIGVGADLMKQVSSLIPISLKLVPTPTWEASLQKAQHRECDILAMAQQTPQRKHYLDFTTPFLEIPVVIATKSGIPFIDNLEKIKSKKLAIVKDYSLKELLVERYKGIELVEVNSIQEGLLEVHNGTVFGLLDNAIVINYELIQNNIYDLSISGQFQERFSLSIASRNDEPLLHDILQIALDSIDVHTRDAIKNRWDNIVFKAQTDYRLIMQIVFFACVIVALFAYWNIKLKQEIAKKENVKAQLRQSEIRFRTLFDIAPVMLDAFDKDGKVILWNKECERVFGWTYEEVQNVEDPLALFYPDAKDREIFYESLHAKHHKIYKEWHPITKNGKELVTMWANIHMPSGEIIHIGYDITQQRQDALALQEKTYQLQEATKALEELNETLHERIQQEVEKNAKQQFILAQQNRLAQMGEMIENIAHQWRQPLAQINSSVLLIDAVLYQENMSNKMIEAKLTEIESLTSYMSKTIDDFKNFFHPDKEAKEFFIDEVIRQALLIVQGSYKDSFIEVFMSVPTGMGCYGYPQELEQVIVTILNNAKDAFLNKHNKNAYVKISLKQVRDAYLIFIEDNAGGIPQAYIEKIFEPYFTTKHKTQGTGLGLYMAKMLMQEGLGGKLCVANTQEGACFEIYLPKRKRND